MPPILSKLRKERTFINESYDWFLKSKDNPKDIVDTPHQQELKQWRKVVNGIYTGRKESREAKKKCQQFSPSCPTKEKSH